MVLFRTAVHNFFVCGKHTINCSTNSLTLLRNLFSAKNWLNKFRKPTKTIQRKVNDSLLNIRHSLMF